jgi:hypothetical protein
MIESANLILENKDGEVIRTFLFNGNQAHVIQRSDTKRLEVLGSLEDLYQKKIKFNELGQIRRENLDQLDFAIPGLGKIKNASEKIRIVKDPEPSEDTNSLWYAIFLLTFVTFVGFLAFLFNQAPMTDALEQELRQEVVKLIQKVQVKPVVPKTEVTNNQKTETAKPVKPVIAPGAVKRMGALGVLGSLKNSPNKGGLNLGAAQTTAGPGLGGNAGSGGVQTNMYAKGLVGAPLGAGANVKGAGGYGTKGKGGGQAGYGNTSLIGSTGGTSVALASEATSGGGLDRDAIAAVIQRNIGQVRFCYEQALQGAPDLNGRVSVDFVIGGSGQVKTAGIGSTSLNSKAVEDCILLRLKSWKFPLPENGVDVKVSYPFVLRRSGQG